MIDPARFANRFWSRVDRKEYSKCWPWQGPRTGSQDYGIFCCAGSAIYAHRFAYMLNFGEIPKGQVIMHTCDMPHCVNPLHLKAGSQRDNIRDSVRKGRWLTEVRWKHLRKRQPRGRDGRYLKEDK